MSVVRHLSRNGIPPCSSETSAFSIWEQIQRPTANVQSERDSDILRPKWEVFIQPSPLVLRRPCGRGRRKICKSQRDGEKKERKPSRHNLTNAYMNSRGWRDGSVGKSTRLLFRRSEVQIPATTCSQPSIMRSDSLFWSV